MRNPIFRSKISNSDAQRLKNKKNETSFSEPPAASHCFAHNSFPGLQIWTKLGGNGSQESPAAF